MTILTMYQRIAQCIVICIGFAVMPALAETATDVDWEDLVPQTEPIPNPLDVLTPDQKYELAIIARTRQLEIEKQLDEDSTALEDASEFVRKLKKQGVDVEDLIEKYGKYQVEVIKQSQTLVDELDGKHIRVPGYLLPLEFSDTGGTDFLLVPYVGACIHVPPPPPNQIVFVQVSDPYKVQDLYTPVWVTGRMTTKSVSKSLSLVDGQSKIAVGYTLSGEKIEEYSQ